MTKKEIQELSNLNLIQHLIFTSCTYTITKSMCRTAAYICEELHERGVIDDSEELFRTWRS